MSSFCKINMGILRKKISVLQICMILNFSDGKLRNAIAFYKNHGTCENIPCEKPRKTSLHDDRLIAELSKPHYLDYDCLER